jgi:XTP/dITP diphosphohydrolase
LGKEKEIVFVTTNYGKFKEVENILLKYNINIEMINMRKIEIQDDDLTSIATYAALTSFYAIRKPVLIDDSGLYIEELGGFPGPYSDYVIKKLGLNGVIEIIRRLRSRKATFISALAYYDGKELKVFKGEVNGELTLEVRGSKGFGFDPIFIPMGSNKTFGEMTTDEKSKISHRAKAVEAFAKWYSEHYVF